MLFSKLAVRRLLLTIIPCFFSLILIGCGFSPVYLQNGSNAEIAAKLASVEVKPIQTLVGQEYVTALEDVLNPAQISVAKDYIFETTIIKSVLPLAIERDRTVTRYKVVIMANYSLKEIASNKILSQGQVKNEADYDRVDSDYATYVSENDTAHRAIRELAQDTKIKIISALLKP